MTGYDGQQRKNPEPLSGFNPQTIMAVIMTEHTPENAIEHIRDLLGPQGWIDDPSDMDRYLNEQRGLFKGTCSGVARPASCDKTALVMGICAKAGLAVTPQGGNTGLVGGGIPMYTDRLGIVLSTERLNRIRSIDPLNQTMTVEGGVVLADIQKAAADAGLLFPLSLGAEGSCRIGGNLATNAGGVGVLRYGNARDLVLGLEVVLADGRVWDGLVSLRKDNTGYDLKHLFMGSEGTLGIITACILKLYARPKFQETALCAAADPQALLELFQRVREAFGDGLTAFEIINNFAFGITVQHIDGCSDPFEQRHPEYALVEISGMSSDLRETLEVTLGQALEDGVITDAVIAESGAQSKELWRLRETIPEAQKHEGASIKHDVSVPISSVPDFLARANDLVERELPGTRVCAFGHAGDGNMHYNLSQPVAMEEAEFLDKWKMFNGHIHDLVMQMGGSFSAEHGIGMLKRDDLVHYKSDVEIDLMRQVKQTLDPNGILNPGKVL